MIDGLCTIIKINLANGQFEMPSINCGLNSASITDKHVLRTCWSRVPYNRIGV